VELLSVADDPLVWFTNEGVYTRTCRRGIEPNFNHKTAEKTIGKLTRRSQYVYSARTDDGIGYVLVYSWDGASDESISLFDQVLTLMEDTKALIIDVRPNEGGIPETAMSVAGWFVQDESVVLKSIFRDARRPSGMTPAVERKVSPRGASKRYEKRVAILMGARTMATSEWFVLAAKTGRRVRTFGAKTRGASGGGYCSQLPNAVQFCVARSRDTLPDGSPMDGITPDHPVEAKNEVFRTSDPVLEAAMAALRKRMK
ncbi:MAG TPA: S41 family peptidase, partial [Phycisphaerae bacterium]|nr:S41 family peptidase [Phycisphaerae bacterium]